MEQQLITLAIRTFDRAKLIEEVLIKHGIETVIDNLHLDVPGIAVGVRIRIKELDLPQALIIVEETEIAWENKHPSNEVVRLRKILIPIDFAEDFRNLLDFGFNFAHALEAEVIFFNVYYNPLFSNVTSFYQKDVKAYHAKDSEIVRRVYSNLVSDVENLTTLVNRKIDNGELPNCPFRFELKDGLPEDEIITYCKINKPTLVVMGTHGKRILEEQYKVSVTAEVMESCQSPVLGIPVNLKLEDYIGKLKVAFLTNFEQKDLISIDRIISLLKNNTLEFYFIHAYDKNEIWTEVMFDGITRYFEHHYPGVKTNYALVDAIDDMELINDLLISEGVNVLALNTRKQSILSRIFNLSMSFRIIIHSDIPLFVTNL